MKRNLLQNVVVLALVIFVFGSSSKATAQDEQENEPKLAVVPPDVMKEVVGRILRSYFRPRAKEKIIYLLDQDIDQRWLPAIRNVKFQLLTAEEIETRNAPVYFFHPAIVFDEGAEIGFSYRNHTCGYSGDTWYFRVHPNRIELRDVGSHRGSCSSHAAPSFSN